MKVRVFNSIVDYVYVTEVCTEEFTENEKGKMAGHGEPEVDVGGHFVGTVTRPGNGPITVDFTLPSELRRAASDFPLKKGFDLRDDATSDVKMQVYASTIVARLQAAMTTLLGTSDYFVGEYVYNPS